MVSTEVKNCDQLVQTGFFVCIDWLLFSKQKCITICNGFQDNVSFQLQVPKDVNPDI